MALPDRGIKPLRLTQEQSTRLERAADGQNLTQQAFMVNAIMRAIEDQEAKREQSRDRRSGYAKNYRQDSPLGLGLFRDKPPTTPVPEVAPPGQVVVNVGKQDVGSDDIVSRLVDSVTSGPEFNRDDRMQAALESLRRLARNESEREEMTQRLKDAVSARSKTRSGASFWDSMKELIR